MTAHIFQNLRAAKALRNYVNNAPDRRLNVGVFSHHVDGFIVVRFPSLEPLTSRDVQDARDAGFLFPQLTEED